jgi:hypothetical protein
MPGEPGLGEKMRTLRSLILAVLLGLIVLAITGFLAGLAYRSTDDGTLVDWFGAIGSALAIAVTATFGIDRLSQGRRDDDRRRQELGAAAFRLADQAMALVTDRLEKAIAPRSLGSRRQLRGDRTRETIEAMREIEPHMLPTSVISPFVELRTCVFAINAAIDNHYRKVADVQNSDIDKEKLRKDLVSSARVHGQAREAFETLAAKVGEKVGPAALAHRSDVVESVMGSAPD